MGSLHQSTETLKHIVPCLPREDLQIRMTLSESVSQLDTRTDKMHSIYSEG